MTTTALPSGLYRIQVAGGVEPQCLTRESEGRVTILPPSDQLDAEQKVMRCYMTSSIDCCSPTMSVAN